MKPLTKSIMLGLLAIDAWRHGEKWSLADRRVVSDVLDALPDNPAPIGTPEHDAEVERIGRELEARGYGSRDAGN